jgi:hypothetical protein
MSKLQDSLRSFLTVEGIRTATVIDVATGMIIRSVGKADQDLPTTAACVADEARTVRGALSAGNHAGDLVEIATVTDHRLQVATMLRSGPGDGLVLFIDVERGKSNLGLTSLAISQLAPSVLA